MHFLLLPKVILLMRLMLMASLLPMDNQESTSGHMPQEGLRLIVPITISVLAPLQKVLNLRHLCKDTISVMKELQTLPPLFTTIWMLHFGMARAVYRAAAAVLQVACLGSAAPSHGPPRTILKCAGALTKIWVTRLLRPSCWRSLSSSLCALWCTLPVVNTLVHSLGNNTEQL